MRLYQNEPLLLSKSSQNVVHDLHELNNTDKTNDGDGCSVNNNNNNCCSSNTDNNNNGDGVASNGVKLRSKRNKHLSPLSNRHSWSEYRTRDDSDQFSAANTDRHRKNSLVKRSWTGSELKLSDIKEVSFESGSSSTNNLIYNRRNAISNLQLNQIASSSSSPPEKKPGWMGGIRRKISVTVSISICNNPQISFSYTAWYMTRC